MTKILITGSSGYIGSCLNKFFRNNKNIYLIDKIVQNNLIELKYFFKCDLTNIKKLEIILSKVKPDIIIHLAARSTVNQKIKKELYV